MKPPKGPRIALVPRQPARAPGRRQQAVVKARLASVGKPGAGFRPGRASLKGIARLGALFAKGR